MAAHGIGAPFHPGRVRLGLGVFGLGCLLLGCTGPQGPAGPQLTGQLTGFVYLTDPFGTLMTSHSGVLVSVDGTTRSARSESTGQWVVDSLKTGTYQVAFTKSGYGASKHVSVAFVGGGEAYLGPLYLTPLPEYQVATLTAQFLSATTLEILGTMSSAPPAGRNYGYRLFLGLTEHVSWEPSRHLVTAAGLTDAGSRQFRMYFDSRYLFSSSLASGTQIYVSAYGTTGGGGYNSGYLDLSTGRWVYTSVSQTPSPVVSFRMP